MSQDRPLGVKQIRPVERRKARSCLHERVSGGNSWKGVQGDGQLVRCAREPW